MHTDVNLHVLGRQPLHLGVHLRALAILARPWRQPAVPSHLRAVQYSRRRPTSLATVVAPIDGAPLALTSAQSPTLVSALAPGPTPASASTSTKPPEAHVWELAEAHGHGSRRAAAQGRARVSARCPRPSSCSGHQPPLPPACLLLELRSAPAVRLSRRCPPAPRAAQCADHSPALPSRCLRPSSRSVVPQPSACIAANSLSCAEHLATTSAYANTDTIFVLPSRPPPPSPDCTGSRHCRAS